MDADPPAVILNEITSEYFARSQSYWLSKAQRLAKEEGIDASEKQVGCIPLIHIIGTSRPDGIPYGFADFFFLLFFLFFRHTFSGHLL